MNTTLYFLRHGMLEDEKEGVLHNPNDPVSLSEVGRKQITDAAKTLKEEGIEVLISSTETRTRDSAALIKEQTFIPVQLVEQLSGRNWGSWAGRKWNDVQEELSSLTLQQRYMVTPPGGESWKDFESRVVTSLDRIVSEHIGKKICLVSHGSVIRVLLPKVFGLFVEESFKYYPDYGSLSTVEHDGLEYVRPRLV
ncbi:histidine phosphatase family protein [Patescibacteria group bacterium]|nr:histidine phosphatase family protein [Patescibacteria group bacterium]